MTGPQVRSTEIDPADGEVGDALAIQTPLSLPRRIEEYVAAALAHGSAVDFDEWRGSAPHVRSDAGWEEARTLRGEFIVELCTSIRTGTRSFPRGMRIKGARIEGDIDLVTGGVDALLLLERCRILGSIKLRDCTTKLVNLAGSFVRGDVSADRLRSSAGVYLRDGFVCAGTVRLTAAVIEGDLDCTDARILGVNPGRKDRPDDAYALRCDRARVAGSVILRGLTARSTVRLLDAKVGANVVCERTTLFNAGRPALLADNARIDGSLVLRNWRWAPRGWISVRNASAGVLQLGPEKARWPAQGSVRAQGFRYLTLEDDGSVSRPLCEKWLALLSTDPFSPQQYEKCAQVLRENGLASDAKHVAIRRRRVQRGLVVMPEASIPRRALFAFAYPWRQALDVFLDLAIGYGYRPGRSVWMLTIIAAVGAGVFFVADDRGAMVPSDNTIAKAYRADPASLPPGYPPLVFPVYSLDVLLPIIDFQQDSKWRPDPAAKTTLRGIPNVPIGGIAIAWSWFQIAVGWVLSTLLVGSVTGLIRKE